MPPLASVTIGTPITITPIVPGLPGGGGGGLPGLPGQPQDPFQPPIGPGIPGTPLGAGICPSGTRCVGPSVQGPYGMGICLGTCSPYAGGGNGDTEPIVPIDQPQTPLPTVCDEPTMAYCRSMCPCPATAGNGGGSCAAAYKCTLPNGRAGKLNKTGYWLKNGTYVPPGTRCVTPRRKNFANGPAATRAADRVAGTYRMLEKFDKIISKKFKRAGGRRRSTSRRSSTSCSCRS